MFCIWTTEYIDSKDIEKWEKEQKKWALNGETLVKEGSANGKLKIKVIQPFKRYSSYEEGIKNHSEVLMDDRYSSAAKYKDNPYIYITEVGLIYATGPNYGNTAAIMINDYLSWDNKENDWEEYNEWKSKK